MRSSPQGSAGLLECGPHCGLFQEVQPFPSLTTISQTRCLLLPLLPAPAPTVGWHGAFVGHGVWAGWGAPSRSRAPLPRKDGWCGGPAGVGRPEAVLGSVRVGALVSPRACLSLCLGLPPKQFKRSTHLPVCSWDLPAQQHQPQPREARQRPPQGPQRRGRRGSTKVGLPSDPPQKGWEAYLPNLEARDRVGGPRGEGTKWHSGPHPAGSGASGLACG